MSEVSTETSADQEPWASGTLDVFYRQEPTSDGTRRTSLHLMPEDLHWNYPTDAQKSDVENQLFGRQKSIEEELTREIQAASSEEDKQKFWESHKQLKVDLENSSSPTLLNLSWCRYSIDAEQEALDDPKRYCVGLFTRRGLSETGPGRFRASGFELVFPSNQTVESNEKLERFQEDIYNSLRTVKDSDGKDCLEHEWSKGLKTVEEEAISDRLYQALRTYKSSHPEIYVLGPMKNSAQQQVTRLNTASKLGVVGRFSRPFHTLTDYSHLNRPLDYVPDVDKDHGLNPFES